MKKPLRDGSHRKVKPVMIVLTYLIFTVLLIIPLLQIGFGAAQHGMGTMVDSLLRPEALHAFWITAAVVLVVTVINTLFGVSTAILIVRGTWLGKRLRKLLNSLIDLPFAVSPIVAGFMIVLMLGPNTVLGALFAQADIAIVFAFPGMVIATLFVTYPLMVREVVPVLEEIGTQQEEAARLLGSYSWTTFWRVTWPSIRWGVVYGIVLTVARSLGEFGAVLVVSGNIMNKTQTVTTLVYQDMDNFNIAAANSLALMLAIISITLLLIMEWVKRRKGGLHHAH